jgi:hypothetical protein
MGVDGFMLSDRWANENRVPVFFLPSVSYIYIYIYIYTPVFGWRIILLGTCSLAVFLLNLFIRPWRWRRYVPPKCRLRPNRLHGVISQKKILFIITTVKASNPTRIQPVFETLWFQIITEKIRNVKIYLMKTQILIGTFSFDIVYICLLSDGYWGLLPRA